MRQEIFNCQKLFDEWRKRGYTGGIIILRDWVKSFRQEERRITELGYETEPGRQAQADRASFEYIFHQRSWPPFSSFVMEPGFS